MDDNDLAFRRSVRRSDEPTTIERRSSSGRTLRSLRSTNFASHDMSDENSDDESLSRHGSQLDDDELTPASEWLNEMELSVWEVRGYWERRELRERQQCAYEMQHGQRQLGTTTMVCSPVLCVFDSLV